MNRDRQHFGYAIGGCVGVAFVLLLLSPELQGARAKGPMNRGHEDLECQDCHQLAVGTARQQVQANVAYALGRRDAPADFGFRAVTNRDCVACHERPDDRHPVFRFLEPRFADARKAVGAHRCAGCHAEHGETRVSNDGTFCVQCHEEMSLEHDPAQPSHQALTAAEEWGSCLRCHDFHGNHRGETPTHLDQAAPESAVRDYLGGGDSPYEGETKHRATRTRP